MAVKVVYHDGKLIGPGEPCAVDEGTQNNVRGNVVGFIPRWVRDGLLTENEAENVLSLFNALTGDHVEMKDGNLTITST